MNDTSDLRVNLPLTLDEQGEAMLHRFETCWQRASDIPADIGEFLNSCQDQSDASRRQWLIELVLVDLEYRWKTAQRGRSFSDRLESQPSWYNYQAVLADLGAVAELPASIVAEEYRVRMRWGDRPTHDAFLACYPFQVAALVTCLQQIDRELAAERAHGESPAALHVVVHAPPCCEFTFDDFLLQKHLGTGGMGKVYRAWQRSAERTVAVKTIRKQHRRNPAASESLLRELSLMRELQHPAIVRVHGLGSYPGGGYFLVEDFIDGPNLQTVIEQGPLPVEEAVRITLTVAKAVEFAHEQGVLHCDLKPANVLQNANGQTFVADFGFGQWMQTKAGTLPQPLGGTWGYAAPEMILPELGALGARSDVFGLGALCYALLTGMAPRVALDPQAPQATMNAAVQCTREKPSAWRTEIPAALDVIVLKCLANDQAERHSSASQLAAALASVITTASD